MKLKHFRNQPYIFNVTNPAALEKLDIRVQIDLAHAPDLCLTDIQKTMMERQHYTQLSKMAN